jgi:hypothetical protein
MVTEEGNRTNGLQEKSSKWRALRAQLHPFYINYQRRPQTALSACVKARKLSRVLRRKCKKKERNVCISLSGRPFV